MATLVSPLITVSDGGGIPDRLEEHWNMNIHDARDEADDYDGKTKNMLGIMCASSDVKHCQSKPNGSGGTGG